MRKIFTILYLFFLCNCLAQSAEEINDVKKINNRLGISDILFDKEFRLYKSHAITSSTELFRMFYDDNKIWHAYLYHYRSDQETYTVTKLSSVKDLDFIWLQLFAFYIEKLPNIKDIAYKFNDTKVVSEQGQYYLQTTVSTISDGTSYKAYFKFKKEQHIIDFTNYKSYLKRFPEVDELIAYQKIMTLISNNFEIWEKE